MRVGISPWQEEGNAFEITKDANVTPLFEEQHKHPLVSQAVCGLPKASRPPGNMPSRPSGPPRLPPPSCLPSLLGSLEPTAHSGHGPETRGPGEMLQRPSRKSEEEGRSRWFSPLQPKLSPYLLPPFASPHAPH